MEVWPTQGQSCLDLILASHKLEEFYKRAGLPSIGPKVRSGLAPSGAGAPGDESLAIPAHESQREARCLDKASKVEQLEG